MAMTTTSSGLQYEDTQMGGGAAPARGQTCVMHYTGWLWVNGAKGAKFDSSVDRGRPFEFPLGQGRVIKGWDEGVATMTIAVGMGLNTGEAFAGNVGSHRRLEYTVLGDPVNVAARLCANAAGGEILVSGEFLAALREPVRADRLAELALKGKARAVEVFRLAREAAVSAR
jgi:hypothetical protein